MKIINNLEVANYIAKCKENILRSLQITTQLCKYEDIPYGLKSEKEEKELLSTIIKLGYKSNTLLMDEKELTENPFYKNINFTNVKSNFFTYKEKPLPPKTLLNMSWLQENNRCMDDFSLYGYFNKELVIPILSEVVNSDRKTWMSVTIAEQRTLQEGIDKASGNVLKFGLGIGYFPYMCSLKDNVTSITIIEINEDVIELFNTFILPQFDIKQRDKIKIIKGDAFDYFNKDFIDKFDYSYVDIWEDDKSGLQLYIKLLEQYNHKADNMDYWVEHTLTHQVRMTMLLYIQCKLENSVMELLNSLSGFNFTLTKKIHKYMMNLDEVVSTKEQLQKLLYDKHITREILSIKI